MRGFSGAFPEPWPDFLYWAGRFSARTEFDQNERNYKLKAAEHMAAARAALRQADPTWTRELKRAYGSNLTNYQSHSKFLDWVEREPLLAGAALTALWEGLGEPLDRFEKLAEAVGLDVLGGVGTRTMSWPCCCWP